MSDAVASPALPQGALRLSDWGLIRASGAEAAKFLHSQLTQDIEQLPEDRARLAGYCSAKGRLLATFVVWRAGADILLACSADLLPVVLKRLSMFVLRAQCKLTDASAELPLWGVVAANLGSEWSVSGAPGAQVIELPPAVVDGQTVARRLHIGAEPAAAGVIDIDSWRWLEVHSGVPRIAAATVEQFVPQMINLELVGGVNFRKGCYPGQEVVARSQYRGTLKRRGQVVQSPVALAQGQEIFHSADPGQPAGMVVLAGSHAGAHAALVEVKLAALESGTLHATSADGPLLTTTALPYVIPAEAA